MTTTTGGAGSAQVGLRRADGVELIGEMAGSGYRVPPSLVRRADGQTIQLTPLLYAILREIDGRTPAEVAAAVSASTGRNVSEDNVRHFVDDKLRRLGLLVLADGSQPTLKKRMPLLGLRFRHAVTDPDRTRRLTDPFRFLFRPWMVIPILAAFVVVCWWVFFSKGLASAAYEAFERPGLLILVFVVTVLSAGFHEFGHAAAARYGGSTPGVMGFGLYLFWPAFYTDVTDSYKLGRVGRLRTDLGGLYFNAIVAVAITGLWWWLQYDALLLVVATQILQMLRQLAPLVRFDGYHVLADLTGVPDLYSRIRPTLLGALPWRWGDPEARLLKPWARVVVTVWVMVVVPLLLATLWMLIVTLPRLLGTAWASLGKQQDVLAAAWTDGDLIQATARVLSMIAIIIPVAGIIYLLIRLAKQSAVRAWSGTAGKPVPRALVLMGGLTLLAGIAYAWMPHQDNYRPIQPGERGTISDFVFALQVDPFGTQQPAVAPAALVNGQQGVLQAVWDTSTPLPTKDSPQLALIMVPRGTAAGSDGGAVVAPPADEGWIFPVDKPLAPEPGDNQALAVNTTDDTVVYDAAFAMVYADAADATNVNEAHAYASCDSCAAVAVSYQVVFVVDENATDDNISAPENLAQSLNYECANCLTYSLAQQVFITLDEPLTEEQKAELDVIWAELQAYEAAVEAGEVPLEDIQGDLDEFTNRIMEVVEEDEADVVSSETEQTGSPSGTESPAVEQTGVDSPPPTGDEPSAPSDSTGGTDSGDSNQIEPTAPSDPTTDGTTSDGTTSDGTTSDGTSSDGTGTEGSVSDGSTADGTASDGSTTGG